MADHVYYFGEINVLMEGLNESRYIFSEKEGRSFDVEEGAEISRGES